MPDRPRFRTLPVSLLLLAASAGIALWLILPWGHPQGASGAGPGGPLMIDGPVQVRTDGNVVAQLVVPITLRGQQAISLDGTVLRAETDMSPTAAAAVPAKFSLSWLDGNGDRVIDAGEHVVLTVDLPAVSTVHPGNPLALVFKAADGSTITVENVLR